MQGSSSAEDQFFSLEVKALPNALCVAFLTRQADRAMPGVLLESQSWGLGLGRLCLPKEYKWLCGNLDSM